MAASDIQQTMSTKIKVDQQEAANQVENLTNKFKDLTAQWKAEQATAKASGDSVGAAKARYEGLSKALEVQRQKVEQLNRQRKDQQWLVQNSATVTKEQTDELNQLDRRLTSATNKLTSLSNQQTRAKRSFEYASSGLKELRNEYYTNNRAIDSHVEKLKAEGNTAEAQKVKLAGLKQSLANLAKQQSATKKLADEAAKSEGKNSNLYRRRITDYNKVSAAMMRTRKQASELSHSLNPPRISGWDLFKRKILDVDGAEKQAAQHAQRIKGVFSGAFLGNLTASVLPSLQNELQQITTTGMKAAQAGMAMQARWKNIGVSATGIKQLSNQVAQLKANTNLTAQSVNALQSRFYGMTHSVKQTQILTKGVASLSDQLKLSDKQANAFAGGLSRIESSGKVTSSSLGRLEKQAPGLTAAMAKASGLSQQKFKELVASGKMTTDQFNGYLKTAAKNYNKNSAAFGKSAAGAQHKLRAEWTTTQAALAKPLVKVEATGLSQLSKALENKDTQRGLVILASGFAKLAVNAAKALAILARHQKVVVGVGAAFLGLVGTLKVLRSVATVITTFKTLSGAIKTVTNSQKALNLVMKANVFILVVSAIAGLVVALVQLYKHNKKFRAFVNGIGRDLKNMAKGFVKTGRNILKGATNLHKKLSRGWNNYWKEQARKQRAQQKQEARYQAQRRKQDQRAWNTMKRNAANGWKSMERSASNGVKRVGKWYSNMSRTTGRAVQNMARNHPRTFGDMYKVIQDRTRTWHDLVTGHWSRLRDDTGRLAKDQSRANKDIFEDMYSAINKKTGGWLGKVVDSWKDHMSQIGDAISNGKKKAGAAMADLANGVLKPFKTLIDDIQSGINWVLDKIGASKLGGSWSAAIPTFATGTAGNPDGLKKSTIGMVNDGAGSHWRELYSYKGQIGAFPNKRNFITFLPKGMSILNGEDSHKFMSAIGLPRFANGVGSFFDSLEKGAADAGDFIDKVIEHPVQALEDVFKKFIKVSTPIKFATNLITSVPAYVAKQAGNWIKKQFEELADPGGSGVERWRPYVIKALAMLHLSSSLVGKVLRQIQTESGGNPKAMGGTDGLADGHAMGLMQVKPGTFAANKLPGHGNIWNGFDNLLAGLNYARKRYGDSLSFLGQGHGYANGGLVDKEQLIHISEGNRPEMIIPLSASKRGRAYQLLSEVMAQFKHEDGPAQPTRDDQSISRKEFMSLESKLDQLISGVQQLVQVGQQQINATINSGNKLGMRANRSTAYTVMARDQRLSNYMSYRR
ncbi:tape measure protein [Limosilactobacillus reuteri]|uniref:tape measure protein n=1 Tax=Limosilactobacillus reuteri TaxID=1598 RepID=UPI00128B803C|nr:tape measure protein [Limosilactobacillus reuteri]MQB96196.1 lytic transglycosylase [Limosilactobacillus reuteri]